MENLKAMNSNSGPEARRCFPPDPIARASTRLGWRDEEGLRIAPALLLELGAGGTLLVAESAPPGDRLVRVRPTSAPPDCWVEAAVVEIHPTGWGAWMVRLAFPGPCPRAFFEAAGAGLPPVNVRPEMEVAGLIDALLGSSSW
jgi:hypothetical protein